MTPNGTPKRDLSSVDSSMFDRLIIIQVKQMKENKDEENYFCIIFIYNLC